MTLIIYKNRWGVEVEGYAPTAGRSAPGGAAGRRNTAIELGIVGVIALAVIASSVGYAVLVVAGVIPAAPL